MLTLANVQLLTRPITLAAVALGSELFPGVRRPGRAFFLISVAVVPKRRQAGALQGRTPRSFCSVDCKHLLERLPEKLDCKWKH